MNSNGFVCALDIGSSEIKVMIAKPVDNPGKFEIKGVSFVKSEGVKSGIVTDIIKLSSCISQAVNAAEQMADCTIKSVIVSINGLHIKSLDSTGVFSVNDGIVTQQNCESAIQNARPRNFPSDREILHEIPTHYKVDGRVADTPVKMRGNQLQVTVNFISGEQNVIADIEASVKEAGFHVAQKVVAPLASAYAVLTEDEKKKGVCCVDIGHQTTSFCVFENGVPTYVAAVPLGSGIITDDLSQGLRISNENAETLKIRKGAVLETAENIDANEVVSIPPDGDTRYSAVTTRPADFIPYIRRRVDQILAFVLNDLSESYLNTGRLSAGIVLTGGGASLAQIEQYAEDFFRCVSVRVGHPYSYNANYSGLRYSTVLGLIASAKLSATKIKNLTKSSAQQRDKDGKNKLDWRNWLSDFFD